MQKIDLKPCYDVVVIGTGVGGLTAAAYLSKAGFSVCVLEKEPRAGGYLAGFRRKNFLFDTAIHWLNQCSPGGMVFKVFDVIGKDYPVPELQKRIRRYKGEGFDYLLTHRPDEFRDQLIKDFPHEQRGIKRFFKAAKKLGTSFSQYGGIMRTEESMTWLEKMKNKIGLLKFVLPFIPYVTYSGEKGLRKGLRRFFKDERIHQIFATETELLSCLIPIGWAYYGDFQSPPKGGSQRIPQWLAYVVGYYNNDIYYKCDVQKILLEGGAATGVRFEHRGQPYEVRSKYVVAACDVERLYEKMLPAGTIPARLISKLRAAELYSSSVTVSLALDCPTEALGLNEELVHLVNEHETFEAYLSGDPAKAEISVLAPSLRDKSMAPEGQGTLTIYMPAQMKYRDNWQTDQDEQGSYLRGEAYRKLKQEIAEALIDRVAEKVAPGLRSHILFYEVATPVTHWRYTGNKNGTMMGAKPGRANMQNRIAHYQTPVKNLLLGGHWAELGGGVPIASKAGANAALLIFQKEKKQVFKWLAGYMDGRVSLEQLQGAGCFLPYDHSWQAPPTPAERMGALVSGNG